MNIFVYVCAFFIVGMSVFVYICIYMFAFFACMYA